jgi:hypothetical protein
VAKWLGKQSFLDDLVSLDVELYKGLILLKNYPGDPEDLSLNFTIAEQEFGLTKSLDLVPNGSNIAVTRANRMECELRYQMISNRFAFPNPGPFSQISSLSAITSSIDKLHLNVRPSLVDFRTLSTPNGCACSISKNFRRSWEGLSLPLMWKISSATALCQTSRITSRSDYFGRSCQRSTRLSSRHCSNS